MVPYLYGVYICKLSGSNKITNIIINECTILIDKVTLLSVDF